MQYCRGTLLLLLAAALLGAAAAPAAGADAAYRLTRYGMALAAGHVYDPNEKINFVLASAFALYDYDRVWPHRAPDELGFRVEVTAGSTTGSQHRLMTSANMFAVYRFGRPQATWQPYAEAGIGLIYTDFKVDGQGLRFNFNPQAGLGVEWHRAERAPLFFNVRLHHVSNGGLYKKNRGINSVLVSVGTFF
jgi:lipid A 3-O-deacylase